jgi:hypothetical protein
LRTSKGEFHAVHSLEEKQQQKMNLLDSLWESLRAEFVVVWFNHPTPDSSSEYRALSFPLSVLVGW